MPPFEATPAALASAFMTCLAPTAFMAVMACVVVATDVIALLPPHPRCVARASAMPPFVKATPAALAFGYSAVNFGVVEGVGPGETFERGVSHQSSCPAPTLLLLLPLQRRQLLVLQVVD